MNDTPLPSIELRWFLEGPARQNFELKHWFENTDFLDADSGQTEWLGRRHDEPDRYLHLPGVDNLGVKLREGKLQVKGRTGDLGVQQFSGGHTGRLERWMKWTHADLPDGYRSLFSGSFPSVGTHAVTKVRATRKYRLDVFSGESDEVSPDHVLDRGVGVELADIEVNGRAWTSLGLEAFPDDSAMTGHLLAAADSILGTLESPRLDMSNCFSYPGWLARL